MHSSDSCMAFASAPLIEKELLKKTLYANGPSIRTMAPLYIVVSAVTDSTMEWLVGKYIYFDNGSIYFIWLQQKEEQWS